MEKTKGLDEMVQYMGMSKRKGFRMPNVGIWLDENSYWLEDDGQTFRIDITRYDDGKIGNVCISHGVQADADKYDGDFKERIDVPGDVLKPFLLLLEWATT